MTGFSLVELSIVLVILGLLTGGILSGQSLIRAAKLRSVTADINQITAAVYTFHDEYFDLPGDITNATQYWGSAGGDGSNTTCQGTAASGTETCNGNGNGQILASAFNHDERFRAWQHLANAGFIEGSYSGKTDGANGSHVGVLGENVKASKISNSFFDLSYENPDGSVNFSESNLPSNTVNLYGTATNSLAQISAKEAWNIDKKTDDGNPVTGKVVSTPATGNHPGCTTADDATAEYDIQDPTLGCVMRFIAGF